MRRLVTVAIAILALLFLYRVFLARPRVTNAHPRSGTVVCFGDSLTAGTGAAPGESYPDHLSRLLGRPVINAGVPGDTTASALERLERDVLAREPGVACLTLGGNDLKDGVPRAEAFAKLEAIVRRIQKTGALVVIGGIDVPLFGRGFDDAYEELAERTGCALVPNVYRGIMGHPELMSDPIHPNGAGYARIAAQFHSAIQRYL